jgi:AraC-like DNA-binding protein
LRAYFTTSDPIVPAHHPRVLVETAAAQGADRRDLFEGTGLDEQLLEDPVARISYEQLAKLERNALRLTGDSTLGLRWGRALYLTQAGFVGVAALASPTLAAAFRVVSRYYGQVAPGWELDLRVDDNRGFLTFRPTLERGDLLAFATEAMLAGFYNMVVQALGRPFAVAEVRLGYPAPPHHGRYCEFFGATRFVFGQSATRAEFDARLLEERIVTADPALAAAVEQLCATEAARHSRVGGVVGEVRKLLLERGGRRTGIDEIARALRTSDRSLRRALSQMGTSYQEVADEVLRIRAEEWVRTSRVKVEHIAQELGFTDARSFRRAFKRWTGQAPNDFRRAGQT